MNPSSAGRLLDRLARAGLIRRTRLRADRRALHVALSPAGRDLVAQVTQRRRDEFERLLTALPSGQHELVITALHAIADAAGEVPERDLAVGLAGTEHTDCREPDRSAPRLLPEGRRHRRAAPPAPH